MPTVSSVGEWKMSSALRRLAMRSFRFCSAISSRKPRRMRNVRPAIAPAEAGEVEAQNADAKRGQSLRDAPRGVNILAAGEAVGEQCVGARLSRRIIEERGKPLPLRTGKIEPFSRHRLPPLLCGSYRR